MATVTHAVNVPPNRVSVFERGAMLVGHFEVSLAVTKPCWLYFYAVMVELSVKVILVTANQYFDKRMV
jgi:hypothetical protein